MTDLIVKLEAATEGSRELDAEITWLISRSHPRVQHIPHYTTSLDSALTLVPKGHCWTVDGFPDKTACASCYHPKGGIGDRYRNDGGLHGGSTPALALCIAALKAG